MHLLISTPRHWRVEVYDSNADRVAKWEHSEGGWSSQSNNLLVLGDSVFVPDRESKVIVEYSLTGQVKAKLKSPTLQKTDVALCFLSHENTMIVKIGKKISKMDIRTGGSDSIIHIEHSTVRGISHDKGGRIYTAVIGFNNDLKTFLLDAETDK